MTSTEPDNPLRLGLRRERGATPCAVVIFGGSGDLARRKLLPALYNLHRDRLLPGSFAVVGVGRREMQDEKFVESMRDGVRSHSRRPFSDDLWSQIAGGLSYVSAGHEVEDYRKLAAHLERLDRDRGTGGNRLFYLATPPGAFAGIVDNLREAGLHRPGSGGDWARIVLEKPIGRDLASALELNRAVNEVFDEETVFRIDHYLGKETVQNLLVFRFANAIFEPLWNQKYVDHVQITVAESIGVEGRGGYYEAAGATRDMVQNHIFQLLCLTAMEPPVSLDADAIRNEKVKVLQALRPIDAGGVFDSTVRAQYGAGVVDGERVAGYNEEADVAKDSRTETFIAHRLFVDNWRWAGVPFFLRSGKRLPKRVSEIALRFRDVPHRLFDQPQTTNTLALRIQPDEGITLKFDSKVPGPKPRIRPVSMDFRYGTSFGLEPPEAYERLILDAMLGDSTLFIRRDEVEASWQYIDSLIGSWEGDASPLPGYSAGSWGPEQAEELLERDGRSWRRL
jgi:glucose-6-phosphate 1-dehydrogenase